MFRVADLQEPVAVCFGDLNVSVGGLGLARLYIPQVNNGSYDNCGIASIQLRRTYTLDPDTCDPLDEPYTSDWGSYVEFNCCDVGSVVMVEMLVIDESGLENRCWTSVLVEDKTLPYCYGLLDVTIDCADLPEDFDPADIRSITSTIWHARCN